MSEQFATKQLMERHRDVVQGATDRREQREVPSSFDKHQTEGHMKRADPRLVKRADPQRGNSHPIVRDVGGQDKTHLRDVTATEEQTIRSTLPTAATKTRLRMRRRLSRFHRCTT